MEGLYDLLKCYPKGTILYLVYQLMLDGVISFTELAELHVKQLELLKRGESEKLMQLRSKVINLWCGTKKELPDKLVSLMQEARDNGWANINQEQIDNSKWKNHKK